MGLLSSGLKTLFVVLEANVWLMYDQPDTVVELLAPLQPSDPTMDLRRCLMLVLAHQAQQDVEAASSMIEHAERVFEENADALAGRAMFVQDFAVAWEQLGEVERARTLFERLLHRARETEDAALAAAVSGNLANLLSQAGDLQQAVVMRAECMRLHEELGDGRGLANATMNLANDQLRRHHLDRAAETYAEALELADRAALPELAAMIVGNQGNVQLRRGDLTAAEAAFADALQRRKQLDPGAPPSVNAYNLAWIQLETGRAAEGVATMQAIRSATEHGPHNVHALSTLELGRQAILDGEYEAARTDLEAAGTQLLSLQLAEHTKDAFLALASLSRLEGRDFTPDLDLAAEAVARMHGDRLQPALLGLQRAAFEGEAHPDAERSLDRIRDLGSPMQLAQALVHASVFAPEFFEAARQIADDKRLGGWTRHMIDSAEGPTRLL